MGRPHEATLVPGVRNQLPELRTQPRKRPGYIRSRVISSSKEKNMGIVGGAVLTPVMRLICQVFFSLAIAYMIPLFVYVTVAF